MNVIDIKMHGTTIKKQITCVSDV